MFKIHAKCSICDKDIQSDEEVFVRMRYPKNRGMTEIKAYLQNEGKIICMECFKKQQPAD